MSDVKTEVGISLMGRIRAEIDVEGKRCWALFDSGARSTYVVREAVKHLDLKELPQPRPTALGGKVHTPTQGCYLFAKIDGHWVETHARVLGEIGSDEDGRPIEVLFGALAMQEWGIRLDLPNERLDFTHYSESFVEF